MSTTLYGGAGTLTEPNNETRPDEYEVTRVGVGVLGILRPWGPPAKDSREALGFFTALGASFELDSSLHTVCAFECPPGSGQEGGRHLGKHFAARLGFGYSLPIFEFRVGALAAIPDPNVSYAEPLVFPDVMARVGPRDVGWFEVGLGAYSASTNFRPGLYIGGAVGPERVVQVSAHVGAHLVNGLCCGTVTSGGLAADLSVAHAFSNSLTGSVGATLFRAEWSSQTYLVGEGSARLTFAL